MNVNPRISFPPEVDFVLISSFIREACRIAFAMQTLDPPLDLAFSSDGELYSDVKWVELINQTQQHVSRVLRYTSIFKSWTRRVLKMQCTFFKMHVTLRHLPMLHEKKTKHIEKHTQTHVNQWLSRHTFSSSQVQAQFWLRVHRSTGGVSRVACTVGGRHCHTERRGGH